MAINNRKMGEKNGFWLGKEVEVTRFYGMETIFYSRFMALDQRPEQPHVFVALCNPSFFAGCREANTNTELLYMLIEAWIVMGKMVTIEVTPPQATWAFFTKMRKKYEGKFLLLIGCEVPELEAGGYTMKVYPTHLFSDYENEGYVETWTPQKSSIDDRDGGVTTWAEYEADIDGCVA
jgi:hypothetical protein